jgi:hypothetical protein
VPDEQNKKQESLEVELLSLSLPHAAALNQGQEAARLQKKSEGRASLVSMSQSRV